MRLCPPCGQTKPQEEFYKGQRRCKECSKALNKVYMAANKDKQSLYNRRATLRHKYGISMEDFDSILLQQGGGCCVCGSSERLCVDHNHATGEVRGILCNDCNVSAGTMGDSPSRLRALADYLEERGTYGST